MMSAVWGVADKTGEVDDDHNDYNDQNDAIMAADMVRIHLNSLFRFNSEILLSEMIQTDQYS